MNAAQQKKYFFEWGRARAWYLARGFSPAAADAKRHELHVKALGRAKSSKDFSNADLDKVLAVFKAVHDGGNLDAQLQQLDQPYLRQKLLIDRCLGAGRVFITGKDRQHIDSRTVNYCSRIAENMGYGKAWPLADEKQMGNVTRAIEKEAERVRQKEDAARAREEEHAAAVPADAADEEMVG